MTRLAPPTNQGAFLNISFIDVSDEEDIDRALIMGGSSPHGEPVEEKIEILKSWGFQEYE